MKKIRLHLDKHHAITYGYDGLVIVQNSKLTKVLATIMPHHRMDGGVLMARIVPSGRYILTLGKDMLLICSRLVDVEDKIGRKEQLQELLESARMKLMFARKTIGFAPKGK